MSSAVREPVVIVHGLWTHGIVMELVRRRLARAGFAARSFSYRSLRATLTENADALARFLGAAGSAPAHLFGHSLGGLVILQMLARHPALATGRIVLVAAPYGGTAAGERLAQLPGGRRLLGRSVREWLAGPRPDAFGGRELGVIAGSLAVGLGRLIGTRFPGPDDGVVAVAETAVPGMRDRVIVPVSHTGMLMAPAVARRAAEFFRCGTFGHDATR